MRDANPNLPGFLHAIDLWRGAEARRQGVGLLGQARHAGRRRGSERSTAGITFAFDCANVMGIENPMANVTMINPDVTAHVLRPPADEWVAVTGETYVDHVDGPEHDRGDVQRQPGDVRAGFALAAGAAELSRRRCP